MLAPERVHDLQICSAYSIAIHSLEENNILLLVFLKMEEDEGPLAPLQYFLIANTGETKRIYTKVIASDL